MKELGKIVRAEFGLGGYQDCMLGLHFTFETVGGGLNKDFSFWDYESIKHSDRCKWSEEDRNKTAVDVLKLVSKLLKDAKVQKVSELKGIPIELDIEDRAFKDFRILTEVL